MKNSGKFVLPNKPVVKRSDSNIAKIISEHPLKRQKFTSISLQQNLEFFQQQAIFFPKPVCPSGDAESYFKKTLRSYPYFEFPFSQTPKAVKSLGTLKKKKFTKSAEPSLKQKRKPKTPTAHLRAHPKSKTSVPQLSGFRESIEPSKKSEVEVDVFYSPHSPKLESSSENLQNKSSESSLILEEAKVEPSVTKETIPDKDNTEDQSVELPEKDDFKETKMAEEGDDVINEMEENEVQPESETENEQEGDDWPGELPPGEIAEPEDTEDEGEDAVRPDAGDNGSVFQFDPTIDAAVLKELEEAEKQAKATANIIYELKTRVTELLKKEKHTEAEAKELEQKNRELKAQMLLFEEKTKRIQFLITQSNLFDKMVLPDTPLQVSHKEDMLPKVVVCGMTENNIPKLILCDDKKRKGPEPSKDVNIPMSVVPKFAKRLSDSYTMQEKLAAENADLEGMRYKLQSDLLNKDQTIEYLQRQLCSIQCEMRMICKENSVLNDKICQMCTPKQEIVKHKKGPCGKGKGPCPADIEYRLNEYQQTTKLLERQLNEMENDVKTMQTELTAVQAEREHLEQHKKVIICPPLCVPHPCSPPPCGLPPCTPCIAPSFDQQLRESQEKYSRLQDDFKSKVTEVAGLRADNEKFKTIAKDADERRKELEEKVRDLERIVKTLKGDANNKLLSSKEQMIEQEQQLAVAKQRFREAQDELEELRAFIQDQQSQMDDYRNKYLEAQQQVEEQKRQIDMLEMDAMRVSEEVNLEIQRVKAQFQEKLQELIPLPDLLKETQIKLQETQQMHLLAERNNEALNRDLQIYKDKIAEITEEMEKSRNDQEMGAGAKAAMEAQIQELEEKVNALQEENDSLKNLLDANNERLEETERELQAKMHEIAQLSAQLESVREESARQVARNKERCETVRRSMQNQISDMERQLAQSRAQARAAQKDRDEIRQKMQSQINNLHENFEDAQMRIRNLQGHVNFLKESYPPLRAQIGDVDSKASMQDPCNCGV